MPARVPQLEFAGLDNRGLPFVSTHLRTGLMVYPTVQVTDFVPPRSPAAKLIDWSPGTTASVLHFSWTKTMGQPAARWSATIKAKAEGLDLDQQAIVDGDWIDIAILRNGVRIPLGRGVIDSVRRRRISVEGATVATYQVSGRDHGAFFQYPITWSNIWARQLAELAAGLFTARMAAAGKVRIGGRPDELFRLLIEATFKPGKGDLTGSRNAQWVLPQSLEDFVGEGNRRLIDLLKVVAFSAEPGTDHLRGAYYNEPQLWTVGDQTLHQTIAQWVNPVLNEFWCDLLPPPGFLPKHSLMKFFSTASSSDLSSTSGLFGASAAALTYGSQNKEFGDICAFIRERPFVQTALGKDSMWFGLPTWTVPQWLVKDDDLGRSGDDRYNLFDLVADFGIAPQQEQAALAKPLWNPFDIAAHGLRVYSQNTRFFSAEPGLGSWFSERSKWIRLLADWFAPSPYLEQGTILTKVPLPEIRIGHRLVLDPPSDNPSERTQFYVEGVQHTLSAPAQNSGASGSSTFTVTRGFRGTDEELLSATQQLSGHFSEAL